MIGRLSVSWALVAVASLATGVVGVRRIVAAQAFTREHVPVRRPEAADHRRPERAELTALVASALRRGSFGSVAAVDPAAVEATVPTAEVLHGNPPVSVPTIRLKAIVGGPPWYAVLADVPGLEGDRLFRAGEGFGGLQVVRIELFEVWIATSDTTWAITLPERR